MGTEELMRELAELGVYPASTTFMRDAFQQRETGLPAGFTWTPYWGRRDAHPLNSLPSRCASCEAIFSRLCDVSTLTNIWTCAICGNENEGTDLPELRAQHLNTSSRCELREYVVKEEFISPVVSRIVFVVDENIDVEEVQIAKLVDIATSAAIARGLEVALVTFGELPSVLYFGAVGDQYEEEPVVFDVLLPEDVEEMSAEQRDAYFCSNLDAASDSVWAATHVHREAAQPPDVSSARWRIRSRRKSKKRGAERRLDAALRLALGLLSGEASGAAELRVVTLLGGRPTLGVDGSADEEEFEMVLTKRMRRLGVEAAKQRVVLDFYCFAAIHGFAAAALQAAASSSGGGIVLSAMHGLSPHEHITSVFRFITVRSFASGGTIETRSSPSLQLKHVIGPAVEGPRDNTFVTPSVERGSAFGLIFEPGGGVETDCTVQFVATCVDPTSRERTFRCVTTSHALTDSEDEFASGISDANTAILLAKKILLKSFGVQQRSVQSDGVGDDIQSAAVAIADGSVGLAAVVRRVLRMLYELKRGVLLGRQLHSDDALCLRALLCSAAPHLASRLIFPKLYCVEQGDPDVSVGGEPLDIDRALSFVGCRAIEVSCDASPLQSDKLLLMDAGTEIFIWQGSDVRWNNGRMGERCRNALLPSASKRQPPAQIWCFRENDSMSRMMLCRLSPDSSGRGAMGIEPSFESFFKSLE